MKKFGLFILILIFSPHSSDAQEIKDVLIKAYTSQDSSGYYFKIAKKKIKNKSDEAQYYFCKSARCGDFNQHDSAVYYGQRAIKLLENGGDLNSLLTVYSNLNNVYKNQGKYDKAIAYSLKGLKKAEKEKQKGWISFFNTQLSLDYHDYESYQKGIYFGKKALKMLEQKKDADVGAIWRALNAVAINYDDWNKPDSALFYHKKVFKYFKGNDTLKIGSTYNNIGNTLLKQKKYKEAKRWLTTGLKMSELKSADLPAKQDTRFFYEKATLYTNLATIESELNNFSEAEKLFAKAHDFSVNSMSAEKLRDLYGQRAKFYTKAQKFKLATEDHEKYIKLRDSVFDVKRAKTFAELEAKYQTEKKQKELLKVNAKVAERENEIKRKNTQFIILSLIVVGFLIISYLIYRQQRLKNRQQQQEFELKSAIAKIETQNELQEQRLQISRDLHDNIGSQLTFIISSVDNIKYAFDITNTKLNDKLSGISEFAKSTIVELRDTIWAMNKSEITFEDLQIRIHNFIEKAKEAKEEIQFNFTVDKSLNQCKFSSIEGMNIYRTIQEAINNSIKYAYPKTISIAIKPNLETVEILIKDDGIGFKMDEVLLGNGISNMKKRITDVSGFFEIESNENQGTKIKIGIPKNRKTA
jgi:signal transduction histidine kinase/ferritin-like protein